MVNYGSNEADFSEKSEMDEEDIRKMKIIVCLDDKGGMLFHHRRQSADSAVRRRIAALCSGKKLWMNPYSAAQFAADSLPDICVDDRFLQKAQPGEFCFVEDTPLGPYEAEIESITVYHWNRVYPADLYFDIPLQDHGWRCEETEEFTGTSHERITMEVYKR